ERRAGSERLAQASPRGLERASPARHRAAHRGAGAGAPHADPGLLPAREPAASPAERAAFPSRARRGGLSRKPARGARLDPALFRRSGEADSRGAGRASAARGRDAQLPGAGDLREPGGRPQLQGAARARRRMRALLWLLAVFAAAVALVIVGDADSGYVMLVYPPYRVETSMLFFAVVALIA